MSIISLHNRRPPRPRPPSPYAAVGIDLPRVLLLASYYLCAADGCSLSLRRYVVGVFFEGWCGNIGCDVGYGVSSALHTPLWLLSLHDGNRDIIWNDHSCRERGPVEVEVEGHAQNFGGSVLYNIPGHPYQHFKCW